MAVTSHALLWNAALRLADRFQAKALLGRAGALWIVAGFRVNSRPFTLRDSGRIERQSMSVFASAASVVRAYASSDDRHWRCGR